MSEYEGSYQISPIAIRLAKPLTNLGQSVCNCATQHNHLHGDGRVMLDTVQFSTFSVGTGTLSPGSWEGHFKTGIASYPELHQFHFPYY